MFLGNKTSSKLFVLQEDQLVTHSEVLHWLPAHEWEVFLYVRPDPGVGDSGESGHKDELGRNGAAELPSQSLQGNMLRMFNCC